MYTTYFGLRAKPFNVTPEPRFFYANPVYREAYACLLCSVQERKGFISEEVVRLYEEAKVLWPVCLMLLYWITHMWLRAHRCQVTDDAVVVALKDRVGWVGGGVLLTMLAAPAGRG